MRPTLAYLLCFLFVTTLRGAEVWPEFRGPTGDGHARGERYPVEWSEQRNVVWKTPIHDRGWSSPVIWGNQIWVTTATKDGRRLFAVGIDRRTGKVEHDVPLFEVTEPEFVAPSNTFASPTSAIDAERVYVHFGTYGTACLETATGKVLWTRRDLKCNHEQGAGSSLMLHGDLLIVNVDGRDVQYVIAMEKGTGKTVWKTPRSVDYSPYQENQRKAYSTPLVFAGPSGPQLVSPGAKALFAYDPRTGEELWKARHEGWSMTPRPLYGHGLVFAVVDYDHPVLWAVRPDGRGDVTESHVVWKLTTGVPSRPSPLLIDDLLYFVNSEGIASCVEARTGTVVWKERISGRFSASPIYAAGHMYFFNEEGVATVIRPGRKLEIVATNQLGGEPMMASPAAVDGVLYVRTEGHLYRLEVKP